MSVAKKTSRYAGQFTLLVVLRPEQLPHIIQCESKRHAQHMRLQAYGFLEAFRNENPHYQQSAPMVDRLLFRVDGPMLIIEDRDTQNNSFLKGLEELASKVPMTVPAAPPSSGGNGTQGEQGPAPAGQAHDDAIARYLGSKT